MGMFSNYENIAQNYTPNNVCPPCPPKPCAPPSKLDPCIPNKPYADYNAEGELIGYWWYYGDAVDLQFDIDGEVVYEGSEQYIPVGDFLKDKQIIVRLFNFRREMIAEKFYPGSTQIIFSIDKELSKKLVKSVYYCSLLITNNEDLNYTLFYQSDCTLTVK